MRKARVRYERPKPAAFEPVFYPIGFSFALDGRVYIVEKVRASGRVDYAYDGTSGYTRDGRSFAALLRHAEGA